MMNAEDCRVCYIILVGLVTLFFTTCILYEEAIEGRWKEPPAVVDASTRINERIAELPTCVKHCIFNRISDIGCAYNDYACLCREFERLEPEPEPAPELDAPQLQDHDSEQVVEDGVITEDPTNVKIEIRQQDTREETEELCKMGRDLPAGSNSEIANPESFSECIELCKNGASLFWVPAQILDVCDAVEEHVHLPEFMLKTLALYPRQAFSGTFAIGSTAFVAPTTSTVTVQIQSSASALTPISTKTSTHSSTTPTETSKPFATTTTVFTSLSSGVTPYTSTFSGLSALTVEIGFTGTTTPTPTPPPDTGLPIGAKIGIGVAIPLILILLGMLAFLLFQRRRKRRTGYEVNPIPELTEQTSSRNELEGGAIVESKTEKYAAEAAGMQIHELDRQEGGGPKISELKGDTHLPVSEVPVPTHELTAQVQRPRYELTGTGITSNRPIPTAEMPRSPPPAVTRKPVSPTPPSAIPVSSQFPAPWETSAAESAFSAVYPGPGAAKGKEEDDQELREMEEEMARLREEKDRLMRMQTLEAREKELRRGIEARKREKGGGAGDTSGSGSGGGAV